jgi:hypothetical protein
MVLLVLDGLDSELEHSKHCRDAVVRVLDALLRGDAGLRLLLTCEHSLLFNSSERLSNALEWGVLVDVSMARHSDIYSFIYIYCKVYMYTISTLNLGCFKALC